jgi:hypothetical protein
MHLVPDPAQPVEPSAFDRPQFKPLFQSARTDYSLSWTETGLANAAPPEAEGDWPSDRWAAHRAVCDVDLAECRHDVPEPEWWVLMGARGVPLHPDAATARQMATLYINGFKSAPVLPPDATDFVRQAVRDALVVAPQPVTDSWVKGALASTASLVRFVLDNGGPLTRDHVFGARTRNRFLYVHLTGKNSAETTISTYRARLDLVVLGITGAVARDIHDRPELANSVPTDPLPRTDEAALWTWALGLRPTKRGQRTQAALVLGLGVGARSPETRLVTDASIKVDAHGLHVTLVNDTTGTTRVVTCRASYEERLLTIVEATPSGSPLVSPWRTEPMARNTLTLGIWQAQERFPPPAYWNQTTLRNTWMVRHIESGTPLPLLTEIADVETLQSIIRLLPYCETQTPAMSAAAMRRA